MMIKMEFKLIEPSKLKPNNYNPNVMIESTYQHLKKEIQRIGFIVPIVARKVQDELIIVDGEHRWKVAIDLELQTIPVVILEMNESEAKLQTVNTNNIRGEFDTLKFAELLQSLNASYNLDQLEEYLNMDKQKISSYFDLLKMSEKDRDEATRILSNKPILNEVKLLFDDNKFEIFQSAHWNTGVSDLSESILVIIRSYLDSNGIEYPKELEIKEQENEGESQ